MTESEALQALKLDRGLEISGQATRVAKFFKGLDSAEKALKRQAGIRPVRMYSSDFKDNWCSCPVCSVKLGWEQRINKIMGYCCVCGQRLDWKVFEVVEQEKKYGERDA